MTQSGRPVLHPITPRTDVSDEELAQFAARQGVSTLVKPAAQTHPAAPQVAQDASQAPPRTTPPSSPTLKRQSAVKKPASELSRLSVWIPTKLIDAMNVRGAKERASNRYLVLKALKAIGFEIDDADLVPDARRDAPKRGRA